MLEFPRGRKHDETNCVCWGLLQTRTDTRYIDNTLYSPEVGVVTPGIKIPLFGSHTASQIPTCSDVKPRLQREMNVK